MLVNVSQIVDTKIQDFNSGVSDEHYTNEKYNFFKIIFVWFFIDLKSFDELYADGIEAYWNENWEGCIQDLESALKNFR